MRAVTTADLTELLARQEPPCVSLYLPLSTSFPDTQQDRIRYRNLVAEAEAGVRQYVTPARGNNFMQRFHDLSNDDAFWVPRRSGLAVLGSADLFKVFELNRPVPARAVVATSFHVKPLLRIAQSADRFHVLCLQRDEVKLFEGNRDSLTRIHPDGVPWTVTAALGEQAHVQPKNYETHPKNEERKGKSGEPTLNNPRGTQPGPGHPAKGQDAKADAERFFRAVDRAVWEHVSRGNDVPLVIAALPEHQAIFRAVSHHQRVVPNGIDRNPGSMSDEQLRDAAWKSVEPYYLARLEKFKDDFRTAEARQQASGDLAAIAKAAHEGRVGVLLVEAERTIPGRIDPNTGDPLQAAAGSQDVDDLLEDVAETVLRTRGTVVVVPGDRMLTETGLAATNRFLKRFAGGRKFPGRVRRCLKRERGCCRTRPRPAVALPPASGSAGPRAPQKVSTNRGHLLGARAGSLYPTGGSVRRNATCSFHNCPVNGSFAPCASPDIEPLNSPRNTICC